LSPYQGLRWRLDADISAGDDYHVVQMTPPASNASIIFGKGVTSDPPGSIGSMLLAVDDIEAARDELVSHGVDVELFHDAGGSLGGGFIADKASRAPGPGSRAPLLRLVRIVQRSRRQRLAAAGDHGAAPGPGVTDGRCGSCTAPA
jgi:hypothetical protein